MVRASHLAFLSVGLAVGFFAQDASRLLIHPKPGMLVEVYSHHFKKENWKEARKTFQTKFYKEIQHDRKDIRDSYILENPDTAEILGITLWRSKKDLDDWEAQRERKQHLKELDRYRSRPMETRHYRIMDEIIE